MCISACVCAQEKGPVEPCGGRKSTSAQKQTNADQAAVIKSSLVLVMHRNAAERQTALSLLTWSWYRPLLHATVGVYPQALCVSASTGTYRVMSVLDQFLASGEGGREEALWPIAKRLAQGVWLSGTPQICVIKEQHVLWCRERGQVSWPKTE